MFKLEETKQLDLLTSFEIAKLRFQGGTVDWQHAGKRLSLYTLSTVHKQSTYDSSEVGINILHIMQVVVTDYICLILVSTKPDQQSTNSNVMLQ